jgi:alpha-glucoside transport system substrate-binding protein
LATVKPFEDATGVKVEYEGTRDINAVLATRVQGGNPPEIAGIPSLSLLEQWSSQGKRMDLDNVIGANTLKNTYSSGWLELGSYKDKTFGLFFSASLKGLIWYNVKTYKGPKTPRTWTELMNWSRQTAASGMTPWCLGVESGAASGWVVTDWIENILLRQSGAKKYDDWYNGKLSWTSAEVKNAFQAFGAVATDPKMVYGGPTTVLTTNFGDAATPMFAAKPACFLHHQATFISMLLPLLVFFTMQRYFVRGILAGSVKG